jgi:pyrimidine deaminase RibD-like protein/riboflavin biosynthesis pyrimidine reductase
MFMRRCLQLAKNGRENAKPNPMVGAVIVSGDGRIIGEGYHVRCGEGHAEVNVFASVKPEDEHLLSQATIYVSLEPCSHYGKTPPCADLIVRKGVKRCVCGCVDPFAKVQGRGIRKIREAGIEVTVGVLEAECLELNKRFITFNTHQRPYIILKWAQTANGFLDNGGRGMAISSPFTKMLSHKLRAENDAILIGRVTDERDHSQLNVRDWSGKDPMRLVIDRHHPCFEGLDFSRGKMEVLQQIMQYLYNNKVQSLIVEGGAITHQAFLDAGLWDEIRVETLLSTSVENKGITEGEKEENTIRILDICTGSGCIAITLGLDIGGSEVTGWDISEDALKIAQGNVALLDAGNVKIEYQDALKLAETSDAGRWNIIVSNPPYICEKEKADMEKNVLEHEPGIALFVPDEEPLKFYRAIAEYASSALKSGGALYFEINPIYEKETREMLEELDFKDIETKEDAFGKKRMMRAGKS